MTDSSLYERDFHAWAIGQAAALRRHAAERMNSDLDLEHLAEEIEDLGSSRRFAVESFIVQIILHLLKLEYALAVEPREHWKREVATFRLEVADRIEDAPSIAGRLDPDRIWVRARRRAELVLPDLGIDPAALPDTCPYTMEDIRRKGWHPANRHGPA